jgi:drug/metabolite transporter (DMT)-like permease
VIALLLGWWLLDEPITLPILAGSAIVVVAVALVTSARVVRPAPAAAVATVDRSRARA